MAAGPADAAIKEYASRVFKQTEYRRVAQKQIRDFDTTFKTSKGEVRTRVFDPLNVRAIEVPLGGTTSEAGGGGGSVYVTRVRSKIPGTLTAKRLDEYTARMLNAEELRSLEAMAHEVMREAVEEKRKEHEELAKARQKEEDKARREMLKKEREETKAERKRVRDANRAAKEAYDERVKTLEGVISRAKKGRAATKSDS